MQLTRKNQKEPGKLNSTDEMIQQITVVDSKVVSSIPLMEGTYTVVVLNNKPRNYNEWLEWWYSLIDEASAESGNSRYTLHALCKEHLGVASTKDITEWEVAIHKVKLFLLTSIVN